MQLYNIVRLSYSNQTVRYLSLSYNKSNPFFYIRYFTMSSNRHSMPVTEFPKWGLLPKKETGVLNVLNKYPEFDGRGVVIAIFDSSVDPGAAGLQVTSEGKPKVIERFDCSGAGDVDTSTVVQVEEENYITGLTGRKLKIPRTWKNPNGDFHIGVKNAYELYPKTVQDRVTKERREKLWDPYHKKIQAEAQKKLQDFLQKSNETTSSTPSREEKLEKEDLESMVESLNTLEKKYNNHDLGPAYDVVVFHNGDYWCACMDTSEKGDLESCSVLGEYSITRDFAPVTTIDQLNYSINVHENGNLLEIVGLCSAHGTHVASIASAYFPDDSEKNGVAPGAQIVSLSLGDHRLGSMESGTSIMRSMIKLMQRKPPVDVINMSYGEHAHWSHTGRLAEIMNEIVDKYGIVWLGSAGNRGPALCTVGCPPDITSNNIIGVGAYVSPDMMDAEYALRERLPSTIYTWSSRGPCLDGAKGVTIVAPGAAITSVPNFTLRGTQHMNGTSMASPHACGAIAVIISSLKQRKLKYSPYSIRRALENTSQYLDGADPFAQGFGLLQVEKVIDWLQNYNNEIETNVRFHVTCFDGKKKGIHIRDQELQHPREVPVHVTPIFADNDTITPEDKIKFQMSLSLTCPESWVHIPPHLELMNISRQFFVKIDPSVLPTGVHNTSIRAYDSNKPEKGHVFSIEVTLVKPVILDLSPSSKPELFYKDIEFKASTIKRHFVLVPKSATIAVLKFQAINPEATGKFILHCTQLKPKLNAAVEIHRVLTINAQSEQTVPFQVYGDRILEITLAKFWTNLGDISINYSVQFRGCMSNCDIVSLYQYDGIQRLELFGGVQYEDILPNITLKTSVTVLKPTEHKVLPLSVRDVVPPSRQIYELLLTYGFHINKATEVTPCNKFLCEVLYESPYESQLWMVFDNNKRLLLVGDAYPEKYHIKLEKGDYIIRHQIRHEKKELLEKLTDLPMTLSQKLLSNISVDIYACMAQALINGKKINGVQLPPGNSLYPLYIAPLSQERLKNVTGHYLVGSITYNKDETLKKVDSYLVKYYLSDIKKSSNNNNNNTNKSESKDKTKQEEYDELMRDHKTNYLFKTEKGEIADILFEELRTSYKQYMLIYTAMMQCLEPDAKKMYPGFKSEYKKEDDLRLISIANMALDLIDQTELLAYIGTKQDVRNDSTKFKQQMDRQKTVLIDALSRKGAAMCRIYSSELKSPSTKASSDVTRVKSPDTSKSSESSDDKITLENIDEIFINLQKFADPSELKHSSYFTLWHAATLRQHGRLLKMLFKLIEEKNTKELIDCLQWTVEQMKLNHCSDALNSLRPVLFPNSYRLF